MWRLHDFWRDEQGQDLIEYTLLMAFVVLACAGLMTSGGDAIAGIWHQNTNNVDIGNAVAAGAPAPIR